jgi:thiamine-phosphate pyrophosphorylase
MIDYSLCIITTEVPELGRSHFDIAQAAIEGGATLIQLREKKKTTRYLVEVGRKVRKLTAEAGVPLIINDRLDVAMALEADGVHLGQNDLPAPVARSIWPQGIIGLSVTDFQELREVEGASYLGVGPVFSTPSKPDAAPPLGLEKFKEICQATSLPVLAVGGITASNAEDVLRAGARGIAVISEVATASDMVKTTRLLKNIVDGYKRS